MGILASCHRNDHLQLGRMIMKQVALLPHASFVHVNDVGARGEKIFEYVKSVSQRIQERGDAGYQPRLHFDLYGTIGDAFRDAEIPDFLAKVELAARLYDVLIESPIVRSSNESQIRRLRQLKKSLAARKINVKIVADEWCNTLDEKNIRSSRESVVIK
jgi:methylaspartate ammonia-lyase